MASFLLRLLLCLASISSFPASKADEPIYAICNSTRNFTANSAYESNLQRVIDFFVDSIRVPGFLLQNVGGEPDKVFGLAMCQGILSPDACQSCVGSMNLTVAAKWCPQNKAASIFFEGCQIRYSDQDFTGLVSQPVFYMWNVKKATSPETFWRVLGNLMNELVERVASSKKLFATGDLQKMYGFVQCTRDLSPQTCHSCLRKAVASIPAIGAAIGARVFADSCYIRYESYPFFNAAAGPPTVPPPPVAGPPMVPPPPVPGPPAPPPEIQGSTGKENKYNARVIAGIAAGASVSFVLLAILVIIMSQKRQSSDQGENNGDDLSEIESLKFNIKELKTATMHFSNENKLGQGGFGTVYKGVLDNGNLIAVKRLAENSRQGLGELKNEVGLVAKLQHRNLVRLLGYCMQAREKILVYEYLPNKSLDKLLFDPVLSKELSWDRRFKIIEGVARGLTYLHEDSRLKIIHRDVKASNILLDEGMNPKISDFGLARPFENEQSHANTNNIAGSYGYMAPEYVMHGQISTKADVYSFGTLVLEILTGKKCTGFHGHNSSTDLINYILCFWKKDIILQALDKNMPEGVPIEKLLRGIHVGLLCVQHNPQVRPDMSFIVQLLTNESTCLPDISPLLGFSPMMISNLESEAMDLKSLEVSHLLSMNSCSELEAQ